jgi:hypothetical protein
MMVASLSRSVGPAGRPMTPGRPRARAAASQSSQGHPVTVTSHGPALPELGTQYGSAGRAAAALMPRTVTQARLPVAPPARAAGVTVTVTVTPVTVTHSHWPW